MLLDKQSLIPRYYQIFEELYTQIEEGFYKEGDRFPSDTELVKKYGVSRGTIREAIKLIFQRGLLVRKQGKGTFVTHKKIEQDAQRLLGFTELMQSYNINPSAKVIEKTIKEPSAKVRSLLNLGNEDKVAKLKRLRFGNGEPFIIERSYFVYSFLESIFDMDFETNSIYDLLYKHTAVRLGEAKQSIEAIIAGREDCSYLGLEPESPVLLMKRIIKTKEGSLFQYSEDVYRTDKLNFTIHTVSYDDVHNEMGMPIKYSPRQF